LRKKNKQSKATNRPVRLIGKRNAGSNNDNECGSPLESPLFEGIQSMTEKYTEEQHDK
jgi:hypothetical protein